MRTIIQASIATFILSLAPLGLAAPPSNSRSVLDQTISTPATRMEFGIILQRARSLAAQGKVPVLVSDLDGTVWTEGAKDLPITEPKPLPGAVKFFKEFSKYGKVVYLTGRKTSDRKATLATLTRLGFPVGEKGVLLTNPSDTYGNPIEWKIHAQSKIQRIGQPVALMENTQKNAIVLRDLYPYHKHPDVSVLYVSDWKNTARGRIPNGITSIKPAYPSATRVRQIVPPPAPVPQAHK